MSFWFHGRKRQGRRSLYSLDLYWPLIIIAFTILLALLLPSIIAALQFLRNWPVAP